MTDHMSFSDKEADMKKRLFDYMVTKWYGTSDLTQAKIKSKGEDPVECAFFGAIQSAFTNCDKMSGRVPVDQELVGYLATHSLGACEGDTKLPGWSSHCISRIMGGFMQTLRGAVQHNQLRYFSDGKILYGCFEMPTWFIEETMKRIQSQAEHENRLWDENGGWREFLLTNKQPE